MGKMIKCPVELYWPLRRAGFPCKSGKAPSEIVRVAVAWRDTYGFVVEPAVPLDVFVKKCLGLNGPESGSSVAQEGTSNAPVAQVVRREDYARQMTPKMLLAGRRVGLLALLDGDNRAVGKGSAFFARVNGHPVVFTARHVVRVTAEDDDPELRPFTASHVRLMVFPAGPNVENEIVPVGFTMQEGDILWENWRLDVVAFRAPEELTRMAGCDFPETAVDERVTANVRNEWRSPNARDEPLATFVLGFPNVTHEVDAAAAVETLGLQLFTAYITQMEAASWTGTGEKAPQLILELDPGQAPIDASPEIAADIAAWNDELLQAVGEGERPPLGGFSGAPLIIAHQQGTAVIGLVKEGGPQFKSRLIAVASAFDDILAAWRRG
jgi:hypothetical protein